MLVPYRGMQLWFLLRLHNMFFSVCVRSQFRDCSMKLGLFLFSLWEFRFEAGAFIGVARQGLWDFCPHHIVQNGPGAHQVSYYSGVSVPNSETARVWYCISPPSSTEGSDTWSISSMSSTFLHSMALKHRHLCFAGLRMECSPASFMSIISLLHASLC